MTRIAVLLACILALVAWADTAAAKPVDDACNQSSPNASICIGADKVAEAGGAVCREADPSGAACVMPAGHDVLASELSAYQASWVHRTAEFQYRLGDGVPLGDAQWLGTHNSFNTDANGVTPSHTDNNQQLTLSQQLDGDARALELDVHWVPNVDAGGNDVVVCHGRGPDEQHAGCTTEPRLSDVLPEISDWLSAHRDQVLLLYFEDNLGDPAGYAKTVQVLDDAMRRPDGSSMLYRPDPAQIVPSGCANLPLGASRDDVRAAGAQVVLVGNCRAGWAADVFGWDANHVESGSTPRYSDFPTCDATYDAGVYATKLVRYYEDSTWLSAAIDPSESPADHEADALTPEKVGEMTRCGVNLFGFDQFLPSDGRVAASLWSWAPDEPARTGGCAVQQTDGRWTSEPCSGQRRVACRTADGGWTITPKARPFGAARSACAASNATFAFPRTGEENSRLRQRAGGAAVWLDQRT